MPKATTYTYTVRGNGGFPFDMLRYDQCYPRHEHETPRLNYCPRDSNAPREIEMMSTLRAPTIARWQSFGWQVVEGTIVAHRY